LLYRQQILDLKRRSVTLDYDVRRFHPARIQLADARWRLPMAARKTSPGNLRILIELVASRDMANAPRVARLRQRLFSKNLDSISPIGEPL
jgi:hypothetical protein